LLFAILAIVSGSNSYRSTHNFIDMHLTRASSHIRPEVAQSTDELRLIEVFTPGKRQWWQAPRTSPPHQPAKPERIDGNGYILANQSLRSAFGAHAGTPHGPAPHLIAPGGRG
jgi:hypothetical protein